MIVTDIGSLKMRILGLKFRVMWLALSLAAVVLTASGEWGSSPRAGDDPVPDAKAPSPIVLHDVAAAAGVSFRFETGSRGKHDLPEIMGGGVAIFDADGDGRLDIYFCNGGPIDAAPGQAGSSLPALSERGRLAVRGHHRPGRGAGAELCDGRGRRRLRRRRPGRPVRHRLARSATVSQPRRRPVCGRDSTGRPEFGPLEHFGGVRRPGW